MSKPIIGIIGPRYENENKPFHNFTKIVDNFPKRIIEVNGAPVGVTFPEGKFKTDTLDICDGILFQGGSVIDSNYLNTIHYAINKKIPVLGVCVGMQAMFGYEQILKEFEETPTYQEIENIYKGISETSFLEKRAGHNVVDPFEISKINNSKHLIFLDKDSKIAKIYGVPTLYEPSIHNYCVKEEVLEDGGKYFKIVGRSIDGTIEAIENINPDSWFIGVQFHPELEDDNNLLFDSFVKEANKVKTLRK